MIGLSKIRLHHMLAQGVKRAGTVHQLILKLDTVIAAILIGNNFVNISISAIVTAIFIYYIHNNFAVLLATVTTTVGLLVFCEITPKILASKHPETIALLTAPLMERIIRVLHPVIRIFTGISNVILRLFGVTHIKRSPLISEEELRVMIEVGKEEGVLTDEERKMLHKIFEFGDIKVQDVMVRKEKMIAVNVKASSDDLLKIFVEEGHARLPVYEGTIDTIVGVIYARDLLYILRDKGLFVLQDLIHPACYLPPSIRVNEVLRRFQNDKIQIAVIVDSNKKTVGMVTLEDLLEEIVGEIEEQYPDYT